MNDTFTTTANTEPVAEGQEDSQVLVAKTKYPMRYFPDPVLRRRAEPVVIFDNTLIEVAQELINWLDRRPAFGIAAPQLGINKQVFVYKIGTHTDTVVNPVITPVDVSLISSAEGCLSFPGVSVNIPRWKTIKLEYRNIYGSTQTIEATGQLAIVLQHETDHLVGTLFTDYLPKVRRDIVLNKYKKMMRAMQRNPTQQKAVRSLLKQIHSIEQQKELNNNEPYEVI
jgi:peptide deformylase